jgi:transcriptional regulator with XRE-family HTH domain
MKDDNRFNRGELRAVGRQLRLFRIAKGWSLKKLSEMSGVSVAAIRKAELGESNPSLLTVLALVEALDESVDRLIGLAVNAGDQIRLTRAADQDDLHAEILLSDGLSSRKMTGRRVTLDAGEALSVTDPRQPAPLLGYVLDGTIVVARANGGSDVCARGDAFHVLDPTADMIHGDKNGARLVVVEATGENAALAD